MRRFLCVLKWTGFVLLWLAIVVWGARTDSFAQGLAGVSILILVVHAVVALGWIEAAVFALACLTITFSIENIALATGVPFGRYTFLVGAGLPRVGAVPLIVGPLYFAMGYASWVIANGLLNARVERPSDGFALVVVPIVAAFVMTQWDVVMDPSGSTLNKAWVWHDGGGYFGVPLSNFLGWFLTTWCYFQAFSVFSYLQRRRAPYRVRPVSFWIIPVLLYLAAGLCHLPPLSDGPSTLVDGGGRVWSATDLRETAAIVMLFTMLPTSFLALARLAGPVLGHNK